MEVRKVFFSIEDSVKQNIEAATAAAKFDQSALDHGDPEAAANCHYWLRILENWDGSNRSEIIDN
jgi:hypothetical protein